VSGGDNPKIKYPDHFTLKIMYFWKELLVAQAPEL
jgi:hypothetical protein